MNATFFFILLTITIQASGQLSDKEILDHKHGRIKHDTSYVYWLPYENGKRHFLIQAANSKMSHKDELSLDFRMKIGTKICAAREGTVIEVKSDSDKGGLKEEFLSQGNHIVILHSDGSKCKYWHLKKDGAMVQKGDTVKKGQIIGVSGNTGYTAFPHLHFQVIDKNGRQILTRFVSKKANLYLRPGKRYRAFHRKTV